MCVAGNFSVGVHVISPYLSSPGSSLSHFGGQKSNCHLYAGPATNLELQYYSRADERQAHSLELRRLRLRRRYSSWR
jgi:hypothetical protein